MPQSAIGLRFALLLALLLALVYAHPHADPAPDLDLKRSTSAPKKIIYYGRFVSTPVRTELLIQTGAVLVSSDDGRGVIEKVFWDENLKVEDAQVTLLGNTTEDIQVVVADESGWFFPGFIDTHIHAPQYPNNGLFGELTLLEWLKQYTFPIEASLGSSRSPLYANTTNPNPLERARVTYNQIIKRTLSFGTTTASYYATQYVNNTLLLAELAFQYGQRAYVGRVCQDRHGIMPDYYVDDTVESSITDDIITVNYIQKMDPSGDLLAPVLTPRFGPACTPESLTNLGKLAKIKNLRVQTHLSENVAEIKLVSELFPNSTSYAQMWDTYGILTPRTILAHSIHLSESDMELIAARGSGVSHCPLSNSALGSGFCKVRKLIEHGIPVSLGSDISAGYIPSILENARQAFLVARGLEFLDNGNRSLILTSQEALWIATKGGAEVVGMKGRLGGFDVGMLWDVQEIRLNGPGDDEFDEGTVTIFGWETIRETVDKWFWGGTDRNVKRVWVGGRLVHEAPPWKSDE